MALGPSYADCFFTNTGDFTTLSSFTSEASLLSGQNDQPVIRAGFLANKANATGRILQFRAMGVVGCTGTPTYTFTCRLGSTAAAITGTVVGISNAITMQSGVTNKRWHLVLTLVCRTPGIGSTNVSFSGSGEVWCSGFASPFRYDIEPTAPATATWTVSAIDGSVANYFQLSATCSASDPANTITCKHLEAWSGN